METKANIIKRAKRLGLQVGVSAPGDGAASPEDLERYRPGDECPVCGCTLGADDYWYIERDEAPREEGVGRCQ